MEQMIEFAGNHPVLVGGFVIVLAMLIQDIISGGGGKHTIDPAGATELINNQDAVVVDVRSGSDFSKGHIINAQNLPMSSFSSQIDKLKKHKEKPIIVNCNSGAQSAAACRMLKKAGFEKVFNLRGGILAWQSANFPISRRKSK